MEELLPYELRCTYLHRLMSHRKNPYQSVDFSSLFLHDFQNNYILSIVQTCELTNSKVWTV